MAASGQSQPTHCARPWKCTNRPCSHACRLSAQSRGPPGACSHQHHTGPRVQGDSQRGGQPLIQARAGQACRQGQRRPRRRAAPHGRHPRQRMYRAEVQRGRQRGAGPGPAPRRHPGPSPPAASHGRVIREGQQARPQQTQGHAQRPPASGPRRLNTVAGDESMSQRVQQIFCAAGHLQSSQIDGGGLLKPASARAQAQRHRRWKEQAQRPGEQQRQAHHRCPAG